MADKEKKEVQSAKLWHEGDRWYLIASVGVQGETSQREKYGPFDSLEEAITKLKTIK